MKKFIGSLLSLLVLFVSIPVRSFAASYGPDLNSGTYFASSVKTSGHEAIHAFDGSTGADYVRWLGNNSYPQFVGIKYSSPKRIQKIGINISAYPDGGIKDFVLQGSVDTTNGTDGNWVNLYSGQKTNDTATQYFTFTNNASFYAYRLVANTNWGYVVYVAVDELYLYEVVGQEGNTSTLYTPAPSAPSLNAVFGIGNVNLSWNSVSGANAYKVYRNTSLLTTVTGTTYTDNSVVADTTYSYYVTAVNAGGESPPSNTITGTPYRDTTPPAAPTGFKATSGDGKVSLSWSANTEPDFDHYRLYKDGAYIATLYTTSAEVTNLTNGKQYKFELSAVDTSANESTKTAVTVTPVSPIPVAPTNVQATGTAGGSGTISWTPSPSTPTGTTYLVYQNGQLIGQTTGSSLQIPNYNPYSPYEVRASYGSATTGGVTTGGLITSSGWGFTASDVFINTLNVIRSVGGFLLLVLVIAFAPDIRRAIISVFDRMKGRWRV